MSVPTEKPRYHHGDLRNALLDAAIELTRERQGPFFTLRELSAKVGVSHAAPYRHFADRRALLDELAIEGFKRLRASKEAAPTELMCPMRRLNKLGRGYVEFALAEPEYFRIMFSQEIEACEPSEALQDASSAAFNMLVMAVIEAQTQGFVRAGDPIDFAVALWCASHGIATLAVNGQLAQMNDLERTMHTLLDQLLMAGLATDKARQLAPEFAPNLMA